MPAMFDMFTTAALLKAVELMPPVYTWLTDTFAAESGVCEDDTAMYDFRKGSKTGMAPFIVPGTGGVPINRDGYEMRMIQFSTIAPQRVLTTQDISTRQFGEQVFGAMTPEERSKRVMARDLATLRLMNQNRREWMVRQMLLTGKLEIRRFTNTGVEKEASMLADFGFTNYYTPETFWDRPGSDITYDLEAVYDRVLEGGGSVDTVVLGPGVFEAMRGNAKYKEELDIDRLIVGNIQSRYEGQGVRYRGTTSDGVKMYSCHGKFLNDNRQEEFFIPYGYVLVGSSGASSKLVEIKHGPITLAKGQDETAHFKTFIKREVPDRSGGSASGVIATTLYSRPTVIPTNVDAWFVMKVLHDAA